MYFVLLRSQPEQASRVSPAAQNPAEYALLPNYPNPFNLNTRITFYLPQMERVSVEVYDIQGHLRLTLAQGVYAKGFHTLLFDGCDQSSGTYFLLLRASGFRACQRMILLK